MTNRLIARQRECEELQSCMDSNESEFVIVCGRRRIGKTFLVEQFFEGKYDFKFVGGHNLRTRDQLNNFAKALKAYSGTKPAPFKDWVDAVSYTHLDVYKRQTFSFSRKACSPFVFSS